MARKKVAEMQGDDLTKFKQKAAPEKQCPHSRRERQCVECAKQRMQRGEPPTKNYGKGSICEHLKRRSRCKLCGGGEVCKCKHGKVNGCYGCKKAEGKVPPKIEGTPSCAVITPQDILRIATLTSSFACRITQPDAEHAFVVESAQIRKLAEATPEAAAGACPSPPFQLSWLAAVFSHELQNNMNEERIFVAAKVRKKRANASAFSEIAKPTPIKEATKQIIRKLPVSKRRSSTPIARDLDGKDGIQGIHVTTSDCAPQCLREDQQKPSRLMFTDDGDGRNLKIVHFVDAIATITTQSKQKKLCAPHSCKNKVAPPIQPASDDVSEIELKIPKRRRQAPKTQNSKNSQKKAIADAKSPMPCSDDEFDNLPFWSIDALPSMHLENDLEPSTINETLDLHFIDHWKEFMDQNNNCLASQEVLHKLCDFVDV